MACELIIKVTNILENLLTKTFPFCWEQLLDFLVYWAWELVPIENDINCMFGTEGRVRGRE